MDENRVVPLRQPDEIDDPLTEILRSGAKRLVQQAVEAEFAAFLARHADLELPDGRQRVVRHGHDPVRPIQTGIGPVEVTKPKARDRGATTADERIRYSSAILPKWARRTKSLDVLLPALYLRGVSTGDFQEVLTALLGKEAPNLSALGDRSAQERLGGRLSALASPRSVGPALCLCLGGRRLSAGAHGAAGRMHVGSDWRDAGGQEGASGVADGHAGKRSELEGTACRSEGAGSVDRAGHCGRRRRARLLEGPGGSVSLDAPPAVLAAQEF